MNCKPGDLAVIVGVGSSKSLGRFVEVVSLWTGGQHGGLFYASNEPAWICKAVGSPLVFNAPWGEEIAVDSRPIADSCLRPIRDPGEDATDETLTWLPVPSRERETA